MNIRLSKGFNRRTTLLFATCAVVVALKASAGVFDARSQASLSRQRVTKPHSSRSIDEGAKYIPCVIEINNDKVIDQLSDLDCIILRRRANFVITCVPINAIDKLENIDGISTASACRSLALSDCSREFSHIPQVHNHARENTNIIGYTGRGVVTGFCDIGFDPHHIAFNGRVAEMVDYHLSDGIRNVYDSPERLSSIEADRNTETHATHVANIMAGGYKNNPYYGMAPDAAIVATTSDLYDASILCGIEDVLDYAKLHNMPAVVNLSIGSFCGPHDGSDILCRYLSLLAQEIPICFSAGNFGRNNVYFHHTFDGSVTPVGNFVDNTRSWNGMHVSGLNDMWSTTDAPFEVSIAVYDHIQQTFIYESPWYGGDNRDFSITIGKDNPTTADASLDKAFSDYQINFSGGLNSSNNRYNIAVSYDITSAEARPQGWSRYYCAIRVRATQGVSIDSYIDGHNSFFHPSGVAQCTKPQTHGWVSNLCCADNVTAVGAYNSRNTIPVLGGSPQIYDFTIGNVAGWSSYGTTFDGTPLPHICAPGNYVVSAMNSAYYNAHENSTICAMTTDDIGNTYRWYSECGTSMAAPAVAGIFACWLEADPTLTARQLREIAVKTARTSDITDISDPRWGAGAIDALAGLEYVLNNLSVFSPTRNVPYIEVLNNAIHVRCPGHNSPIVEVYDTSGRKVNQNSLTHGVYIVKVTTNETYVTKILI